MKLFETIIQEFIDKMGYRENENVLGVVFYGSALSGYYNRNSDIDLHIITKWGELNRGVCPIHEPKMEIIDGYRIEYFEKTIVEMYRQAEIDFENQSNALLAIIGHGKIIYDTNDIIKILQKDIINLYKNPMLPLSGDAAKELIAIIDNKMNPLQAKCDSDAKGFNYLYYTTVEKIRKFYSRISGCPDIPIAKAERIYTDDKYRDSFCKWHIPEIEFIELFLKAIYCEGTKQEKMIAITNLFNYSRRNIEIDTSDYRIMIKSRHDINNTNHE